MKAKFFLLGALAFLTACTQTNGTLHSQLDAQQQPQTEQRNNNEKRAARAQARKGRAFDFNAPQQLCGVNPGNAAVKFDTQTYQLSNAILKANFSIVNKTLISINHEDMLNNVAYRGLRNLFDVSCEGKNICSLDCNLDGPIIVEDIVPEKTSTRLADQRGGKRIVVNFKHKNLPVDVRWTAELRDQSNYIRYITAVTPREQALKVKKVCGLRLAVNGPRMGGTVEGSPVVTDCMFVGLEHPMSSNVISPDTKRVYQNVFCELPQAVTILPGKTYTNTAVFGVALKGQLRRFFNYYTQNERPYPYRQFLHYNSWYDIGYFTPYSEPDVASIITQYCEELGVKRGVMPKSFLLDDGWDELNSLWNFHSGFPEGFKNVGDLSRKYGSNIGVWLSPFGGYGDPRAKRLAAAKEFGYETNESGFALSGPKYYARFHEICSKMITDYNCNMFKFDGLSRETNVPEGSAFNTDFEAAIALINDLRKLKNDVLINLTTGTWPSPFWLMTVDCIYRGGWDHEFVGDGSDRQRWLNFRDGQTYANIVKRSEVFPINSLMLHGVIFAKHARWLDYNPNDDLKDEVRSFFGTGTMLQELYVTPVLMDTAHWNLVADCAKWAAANADAMVDIHWVGGDPDKQEIYGFAGFVPNRGVLTLRNPSSEPQNFVVDPRVIFELPANLHSRYTFVSPWADQRLQRFVVGKDGTTTIRLRPFEVLQFNVIE